MIGPNSGQIIDSSIVAAIMRTYNLSELIGRGLSPGEIKTLSYVVIYRNSPPENVAQEKIFNRGRRLGPKDRAFDNYSRF